MFVPAQMVRSSSDWAFASRQPPPRSWADRAYNIVRWTDMPRGGHFAAMEAPDLFAEEILAWGREVG